MSQPKRGRGRPTTFIGKTIGLRLYPEMEKQVDDWIAAQDNSPSRPEAIRRLVQFALDAQARGKPSPAPTKPTSASKRAKATKAIPTKKTRQIRSH